MSAERIYSVNEIVAELEQLHGRTVQIAGVLHLEFEGNSILHFPSSERLSGYASSLWADFDSERLASSESWLQSFNGRSIVATATVNKEEQGHLGLWPGGVLIRSVAKYEGTPMG